MGLYDAIRPEKFVLIFNIMYVASDSGFIPSELNTVSYGKTVEMLFNGTGSLWVNSK